MALATDNTALNPATVGGGDVVASEDMPVGVQRGAPSLPVTDYKIPASKIRTGAYGIDGGDVTFENPLPAESRAERQALERTYLATIDSERFAMATSSGRSGRINFQFSNRGER